MKLRVYAERDHYGEEHRSALNDICKAHWNSAQIDERRKTYGTRVDMFDVVDDPTRADVHLLTMRWQHYVDNDRVPQAMKAVQVARAARKPIAIFSTLDAEANFPVAGDDIHLFQMSAYRSHSRQRNHGMPP